jgi:hypothetical protein
VRRDARQDLERHPRQKMHVRGEGSAWHMGSRLEHDGLCGERRAKMTFGRPVACLSDADEARSSRRAKQVGEGTSEPNDDERWCKTGLWNRSAAMERLCGASCDRRAKRGGEVKGDEVRGGAASGAGVG